LNAQRGFAGSRVALYQVDVSALQPAVQNVVETGNPRLETGVTFILHEVFSF
jgi:hypothetical protein